jgi:hypothetical protein
MLRHIKMNGSYRRIGNPNDSQVHLRNCPPLFLPDQWNVYDITINDNDRTNNQTEGWNNRFARLVSHKHPSIWVLISKMRLEVSADETKLAQQALGTLKPKKKKNPRKS